MLALLLSAAFVHAQMPAQATVAAVPERAAVRAGDSTVLLVTIDVAAGLHAQSHTPSDPNYIPLVVTPTPDEAVEFGGIDYPVGVDKTYPGLGKLNVYTGRVVVRVPVKIKAGTPDGAIKLAGVVRYQACDDTVCFPPKRVPFETTIDVSAAAAPSTAPAVTAAPAAAGDDAAASDGPTAFGFALKSDAYLLAFVAAFVVGIIFNAVPCVLPVVPLKIVGFYEAAQHDRRKCFLLGLAFSAGIVASFTVLAVLVVGVRALTWGGLFQQTWFTVTIVTVLTVMALSQFGLFTVNLPMAAYAYTPRHDTYTGNVMFGVLTAALSTPCTIGPFSALLVWALGQPPAAGAALVVVVGCGMAFPYLVLSAFPQVIRRFPRTGPVGEIIKQTLAFLVLATAFYFARPFLNRLLSPPAFWWTLFAIVAMACVFLIGRTVQLVGTRRAITISSLVAAVVLIASGLFTSVLARQPYEWTPYTDAALADALKSGRPVLVDFTADWCGNCHVLEAFVINDPAVVRAVRDAGVVMLRADVTHGTEPAVPLKDKLVPTGEIPLTAVYTPTAAEPSVLKGVYSTADLLRLLAKASPQVTAGLK